ncbi:MAG: lactate racemase domain-containing protein [Armatimonadota bacterium]
MALGTGFTDKTLSNDDIAQIVAQSLDSARLDGKRVLMIVPDHTRTAPVDIMFKTIYGLLAPKVAVLDVIIALGTHHALPMEMIYQRVGISAEEHARDFSKARFFNHHWDNPDHLTVIGKLTNEQTAKLTDGKLVMEVDIPINKMALEYDHLMIVGPVFPHEVVGFSGGNKYLFPGIAGKQILDFFHWLGALITNPSIIGNKYTPVRAVIDEAATYVPKPKSCFAMVVKGENLAGLYYGTPEDAWSTAADLSDKLHIAYKDHSFHTVLSRAPDMYDDIWVGGKCMYKLEPVVADGGRLIIYAPHITEISHTHGDVLGQIGYHTRDYFVKQWDRFKKYPWGVVAHSTHVKGIGTYEDGIESPRVEVILATSIPEERCRQVNLGYLDYRQINISDYENREEEGVLYVPKAGEMLYRLKA